MALLDIDLYNDFLRGILGVNPTGDPVNDAVYLVLLPMVVLYLFVYSTIHNSRFGSTNVQAILMFVVAYFIIRGGYYGLFAAFSLPLLIIVVLWNSVGFILGKKRILSGARGDDTEDDISGIRKIRNAVESAKDFPKRIEHEFSMSIKEEKLRLKELEDEYVAYGEDLKKASKNTADKSSGDVMEQINVQVGGIINEAKTLRRRINDDSVFKHIAPNISKKLGIY